MAQREPERTIRRQRVLLIITACALVVSLVGLGLSWTIKSPAQQALDQGPPPPSQITAPVERKVLSQQISLRGTMASATVMDISAFGPGSIGNESRQIVTALPFAVGQLIAGGDVIAQVSGRPMIALPGAVPAYRTMAPSMSGDDVRQLQQALIALGYLEVGNDTGLFADLTQAALGRLFQDRGYEPIHTWDEASEQADKLEQAQEIVTQQQRLLEDDLAKAKQGDDPDIQRQIDYDRADLQEAKDNLAKIQAASGVEARLGEIVFIPSFPATVTQVHAGIGTDLSKSGGAILSLSCGQIVAWGTIPPGQQTGLAAGQRVDLIDNVNARQAVGALTSIGEFQKSQTDSVTGLPMTGGEAGYPVVVTPSSGVDQSWIGANVQLTITEQSTSEAVLVVPTSAILIGEEDAAYVEVVVADGNTRQVSVTCGLIAGGDVEVTPISGGTLAEGDRVVVR